MRWEVSYNTNEKALQKIVVEANSSKEAIEKAEAIAKVQNRSSYFHFRVNGARVV